MDGRVIPDRLLDRKDESTFATMKTETLPEDPSQSSYRWVMLALLALLYASFGLVTRSMAPLVTPILKDLRISYSEMGLILGSWQLTFVGGSIVAGMLIDRWGIRKSLFFGVLTVALSAALRSLPRDFTGMFLAVMLLGAGAPMISIGCPKTISIWFKGKSRGRAVGIYLCGLFCRSTLFPDPNQQPHHASLRGFLETHVPWLWIRLCGHRRSLVVLWKRCPFNRGRRNRWNGPDLQDTGQDTKCPDCSGHGAALLHNIPWL